MIETSQTWKEYRKRNDIFHIKATMYNADNSQSIDLDDSDFMMGSVSFTDAMSGLYEIDFGAVDTNSFNATLNNFDGKFDDWKWESIFVWFGIENPIGSAIVGLAVPGISIVGTDDEDTGEWIPRGFYHIDRPKTTGNTIKIECYDTMDKLNKAFAGLNATLTYPIQSNDLIESICSYCGVDNVDSEFSDFTVDEFEIDDTISCRQVLYWILETLGGYGRMGESLADTTLFVSKWNIGEWGQSDSLDGGTLAWGDGDNFDGGAFDVWDEVTDVDGGLYYEGQQPYEIDKMTSRLISMDDVEITGVRAFSNDGTVNDMDGTDGYIVTIRDNPLVDENNTSIVANRAWGNVEGLKVRPFEATIFGDPAMEAGDVVIISDDRGNYHKSVITSLEYALNGSTRVGCYALTAEENFNANQ